jgi:predicted nuclease of predicted toxin-antitoxin system
VIAFLVDQNFNAHIVNGFTRRNSLIELIHVRDIGLAAADDSVVLERAAIQGLVLLTLDRQTIPSFAYQRIAKGLPMPGVFLVRDDMPIAKAIEQILIAAYCFSSEECKGVVRYFPIG